MLAGYSHSGTDYDFAIVKYNSNGSIDEAFNMDGQLTTANEIYNDYCNSMTIQTDGKIIVAGSSSIGRDENFAIARYNTDDHKKTADENQKIISPSIQTNLVY